MDKIIFSTASIISIVSFLSLKDFTLDRSLRVRIPKSSKSDKPRFRTQDFERLLLSDSILSTVKGNDLF